MKEEINTVLRYLVCEGEMLLFRDQLLTLSAIQPIELRQTAICLMDAIKCTNIQSHKYAGYYYLFLGCAYYEQDEFQRAAPSLQSAVNEMWGVQVNKALARWLLGLCYSKMQEFPKARNELQEALQLLATHIGTNSSRAEWEHRSRQRIRQNIKEVLDRLFSEPLFRAIRPEPIQNGGRFPVQDPPMDENDAPSISLGLPISIKNENYPYINFPVTVTNENQPAINLPVSATNENYPVNKLSFNPTSPATTIKKEEHKNAERDYENRTDDEGYLVIQSIPVYEEYARAGQSDGPEPNISADQFAEFHQVSIKGKLHTIYSIKSNTKQINVNKAGIWSWIKVRGKSMNATKGNVSINDGDYILFQRNPNANDNDIVIATRNDTVTNDSSVHVKRLRKFENMLYSETTEKGPEYAPIDIEKNNMEIVGIVYAVAKPFPS
jgi:tetratricopeptide (TPR) repeat protein